MEFPYCFWVGAGFSRRLLEYTGIPGIPGIPVEYREYREYPGIQGIPGIPGNKVIRPVGPLAL